MSGLKGRELVSVGRWRGVFISCVVYYWSVMNITGLVINITGPVVNNACLILNVAGLGQTIFVLNSAGIVLNINVIVLQNSAGIFYPY